ncbi:MAG TPA: hypothetical protein PK530_22160, partial [Anaerolineales bacterium]|nr:hypothetical protein [Anaerolineales bacterium]
MVELIALKCLRCETPIPATPDEIAWVCQRCGQGMILDEVKGVSAQPFHFAAGIQPGQRGNPFWVVGGNLRLSRETYASFNKKDNEASDFWAVPRRFFVPAFACDLETTLNLGATLLRNPPRLTEGSPVPFTPVTVNPRDIYPLAEF